MRSGIRLLQPIEGLFFVAKGRMIAFLNSLKEMARPTALEPAASAVTAHGSKVLSTT